MTPRPAVVECERCGVAVSAAGARAHALAHERAEVKATQFQAACYLALVEAWADIGRERHPPFVRAAEVRPRVEGFGHVPSIEAVTRALQALERAVDSDAMAGPVVSAWQPGASASWLGFAPTPLAGLTAPAAAWVVREGFAAALAAKVPDWRAKGDA